MNYSEKITEVLELINRKAYSAAEDMLLQLLDNVKETNAEDEENVYVDYNNDLEKLIYCEILAPRKKVQKTDVKYCEIYKLLAKINSDIGDMETAIDYIKDALKWNPVDVSLMFRLADLYKEMGDIENYKKSIMDSHQYIHTKEQLSDYYRKIGNYYNEKKDFGIANALFAQSVSKGGEEYKTVSDKEKVSKMLAEYNIPIGFNDKIVKYINSNATDEKTYDNSKIKIATNVKKQINNTAKENITQEERKGKIINGFDINEWKKKYSGFDNRVNNVFSDFNEKGDAEIAKLKLEAMLEETDGKVLEDENNFYYGFDNISEKLIFVDKFHPIRKNFVHTNTGEIYFLLADTYRIMKQYDKALEMIDLALKWNPCSLKMRVKKLEIYEEMHIKDTSIYKNEVEEMHGYIYNSHYMAQYLFRLGGYYIWEGKLDIANALMSCCNSFEKIPASDKCINYIAEVTKSEPRYSSKEEVERLLKEYNVKLDFDKGVKDVLYRHYKSDEDIRPIDRDFIGCNLYDISLNEEFYPFNIINYTEYGMQLYVPKDWSRLKLKRDISNPNMNITIDWFEGSNGTENFIVKNYGKCNDNEFETTYKRYINNINKETYQIISENTFSETPLIKHCIMLDIKKKIIVCTSYKLINGNLINFEWKVTTNFDELEDNQIVENVKNTRAFVLLRMLRTYDNTKHDNSNKVIQNNAKKETDKTKDNSHNIGIFKLKDLEFDVENASVEIMIENKRMGEIIPKNQLKMLLNIKMKTNKYEGENWSPNLYTNECITRNIKPDNSILGQTFNYDMTKDNSEAWMLYVFGHENVNKGTIKILERKGDTLHITWTGTADVGFDYDYGRDVPFSCDCYAKITKLEGISDGISNSKVLQNIVENYLELGDIKLQNEQPEEKNERKIWKFTII